MLLLVCTLTLLSCGLAQHEYHYPRPQIPFHLTPQRPVREQPPPTRFVVQTLGPHGRTYELQTHKAPAIYVAHQTVQVPQQQQQQLQQQQYHHPQQQHQQYQQQLPQQLHVQQPLQQLHTSAFKNPLLVNTNYQQTSASITAALPPPPPPPAGPAPSLGYAYSQSQAQGQAQQSVGANYYNAPQALTVATATQAQPVAQYGQPPQVQLQQEQQPHYNSNPQPYAIVTLPNGQRVLDAGHGSGPPPRGDHHSGGQQPPRIGDYSAQSQSATLDTYDYKQSVAGDARSYQRFVTQCQANGQCQKLTLSPGQIDGGHQQLLQAARSQTLPAATGCKKSHYVPPGAEHNAQGQLRPRGRRTYTHVQEQLVKYPYN
ncbi:histone-lysine N-methyltransferase 2D [Drosophila sulfurigaster albostrigata]|uniref:histone-lysine N-methyltransferase 2D n=1 Tax=Drosophila sulfurigaster albostrigata TaxID=89887 RepID=UPI002D21D068|nr:histone-lysine N-methyltransferase 2D [Drosophila sulfurigaster albostrigata]